MIANFLGYWVVAIPLSAYLGFYLRLGPAGLWWGLVVGLGLVGTSLLLRVTRRLARRQPRVVIDTLGLPGPESRRVEG
jgi:multidrug resistance protein, MATE family